MLPTVSEDPLSNALSKTLTYQIVIIRPIIAFYYEGLEREHEDNDGCKQNGAQHQERQGNQLPDNSFPPGKNVVYAAGIIFDFFLKLKLGSVDLQFTDTSYAPANGQVDFSEFPVFQEYRAPHTNYDRKYKGILR